MFSQGLAIQSKMCVIGQLLHGPVHAARMETLGGAARQRFFPTFQILYLKEAHIFSWSKDWLLAVSMLGSHLLTRHSETLTPTPNEVKGLHFTTHNINWQAYPTLYLQCVHKTHFSGPKSPIPATPLHKVTHIHTNSPYWPCHEYRVEVHSQKFLFFTEESQLLSRLMDSNPNIRTKKKSSVLSVSVVVFVGVSLCILPPNAGKNKDACSMSSCLSYCCIQV